MNQDRLEEAFAPLRERTAPAHLRTRPLAAKKAILRPVFLVAVGATGLAAAVVTMWPRPASAAGLLEQAKGQFFGHSRTYLIHPDGKRQVIGEGWRVDGETRLDSTDADGLRHVWINSRKGRFEMRWQPDHSRIEWSDDPKEVLIAPIPTHLDPEGLAMLVQHMKAPEGLKLESAKLDGRSVQRLDFMVNTRKLTLFADPGDLRLIAYETNYRFRNREWRRELTKLDDTLPGDVFKPVITYNGRRIDVREERERIRKEFAKSLAVRIVPDGLVTLRKVAMNSRKDLFVLYTGVAGEQGETYLPSQISDDAGGTYVRGSGFSPSGLPARDGKGYKYDGKPLQGIWFTRLGKETPTRVTIGFRRMEDPVKGVAFKISQPVKPAATPLLDFLPFMGMAPGSVEDLERGRASALVFYYRNRKQWPETERWLRQLIALQEPVLRKFEGRMGGWSYVWLADALARQGKKAAARAALRDAKRWVDPVNEAHLTEEMRGIERRLGG